MKKLFLFIATFFFTLTVAHGQLNPIKNLQFKCSYMTPANCFELYWSQPDSSHTDTLVGYNIYRNDTLYIFTTSLGISCNPCIGDLNATYCNFMYNPAYFYVHVTAVYNISHIESAYNDSIYNSGCGLIIGIKESINNSDFSIYPNPATDNLTIEASQQATIEITNIQGQLIETLATTGNKTSIDVSALAKGMYFVKVKTEKGVAVKKFIKESK